MQNEGGLENWSEWFHKGVVNLLEMASKKAEARTLKALEMDEVNKNVSSFLFYIMNEMMKEKTAQ